MLGAGQALCIEYFEQQLFKKMAVTVALKNRVNLSSRGLSVNIRVVVNAAAARRASRAAAGRMSKTTIVCPSKSKTAWV